MAYRRCLSIRAALLARRSNPSFCYISHEDDNDFLKRKGMASRFPSFGYFSRENDRDKPEEFQSKIEEYVTQRRLLGSNVKIGPWRYCSSVFREDSGLVGGGLSMNRYMSTSIKDAATALTDAPTEAVASQVPAMSEVAIAAADSAFPVAALQYFIDGVHSITGLNWWASIALTSLLFRGATIPFFIHELRILRKSLLMLPYLIDVLVVKLQTADPSARDRIMSKIEAYLFKYVFNGPLSGLLFLISWFGLYGSFFTVFYLAVTNMAEKVPSFKNGGAFWFTDLTTPDAMCILPFLTALTVWGGRKLPMDFQLGLLEDSAVSSKGTQIFRYRVVAVLFSAVALSFMNFPQAMYCHWIASNLLMSCFARFLRFPGVGKALGFTGKQIPWRARKP